MDVVLHIYDVTNSGSEKRSDTLSYIFKFFKDGVGLGGNFHSAVQVCGDDEWSFDLTGIFSCRSKQNPMYTYHGKIILGETNQSIFRVHRILRELSREWPGVSYDLLSRNGNHFCDEFCKKLGVPNLSVIMDDVLPTWPDVPPAWPSIPSEIMALFPLIVSKKEDSDVMEVDILTSVQSQVVIKDSSDIVDFAQDASRVPGLHFVQSKTKFVYTYDENILASSSSSSDIKHIEKKDHIIARRTTMILPKTSKVAVLEITDPSDRHETAIRAEIIPGLRFLEVDRSGEKLMMIGDLYPLDVCDRLSGRTKFEYMKNIEDYVKDGAK